LIAAAFLGVAGCSTPGGSDGTAGTGGNGARSDRLSAAHPETGGIPAVPLPTSGRITLNDCVRYGIDRNFKIRAATQGIRSTTAGIQNARAEFDPSFFGSTRTDTSDGSRWTNPQTSGGVKTKLATGTEVQFEAGQVATQTGDFRNDYINSTSSEYALTVRQQLLRGLDPRVNRSGIRIAELLRDQAQATRGAEILEMLRASESGYYAAAIASLSEAIYRASLRRSESVLGDAKARHAAGAASKLEVLEAEVLVSSARERYLAAGKLLADRVDELLLTVGSPQNVSAASLVFEPISNSTLPSANPEPAAAIQRALNNAPTAVLLVNEIERREIELKRARNNLLPRLEVEFSAASKQNDSSSSKGWEGVALTRVTLPWTFRAERAQLEQAKAELERSKVAREEAEERLRQRIKELCRAIAFGRQQLTAARQSQNASNQKWQEQIQRHKEGLVSVRELREAEEDLRVSEIRVLEVRLILLGAWATLGQLDGSIAQRHNLPL
jgi:outer membrane protein TolC